MTNIHIKIILIEGSKYTYSKIHHIITSKLPQHQVSGSYQNKLILNKTHIHLVLLLHNSFVLYNKIDLLKLMQG